MQKLEEKTLKKNWKNWRARLTCNPGLERTLAKRENSGLARSRPTRKPKGTLSTKAPAKREVAWKLSYLRPIKGVGSKGERHTKIPIPTHHPGDSKL